MGFEKYDKEKEAMRGYGRMSLYISTKRIEQVRELQRYLLASNGDPLSKSLVVDLAIEELYKTIKGKKREE